MEDFDLLTVVSVHKDQTGDTLFGTGGAIKNIGTGFEDALVDADIG